jgi:glycosyltransferase involved in cell wall biosynthesis
MVTIIIPCKNERFLKNTILDVLSKSKGEIEVIPVLDGYWPEAEEIVEDKRVKYLHFGESKGMRWAITAAVAIANGEFIMKLDGHCMVEEGFDTVLAGDCEDNWVVVPRRKSLDAENWCPRPNREDIDYMYICYPDDPNDWGGPGLNGKVWKEKNRDESLRSVMIDDLMSAQGSGWFMKQKYYQELELLDDVKYGPFFNEFQEIGLKCWLSGGRVVVNKKTWYAHLHKGKQYGRGYHMPKNWLTWGRNGTMEWFNGKGWHKQTLPLSWLIKKFWPVESWDEQKLAYLESVEWNLEKN